MNKSDVLTPVQFAELLGNYADDAALTPFGHVVDSDKLMAELEALIAAYTALYHEVGDLRVEEAQ